MEAPSNRLLVPSIILSDLLGSTCLLVIGAFQSTVFVPVFQGSCDLLLVIALFLAIIDQFSLKVFSDLSYSCLLQG